MLFKSQTLGIFSAARILKWIESWIIVSISMIMNGRDKQTDDRECSLALWADRAVWEHDEIRGKRSRKNLIKPFHSIKYLWHFPSLNFLLLQVFNEKFLSISEQQAEACLCSVNILTLNLILIYCLLFKTKNNSLFCVNKKSCN